MPRAIPRIDDDPYCTHCAGTGMGRADGSSCSVCGGSGGLPRHRHDDERPSDRVDYEREHKKDRDLPSAPFDATTFNLHHLMDQALERKAKR
jgi:hypothetical protein